MLASGAPPVLVRTLPWMTGPRAGEVRLSLREHDPAAAAWGDELVDAPAVGQGGAPPQLFYGSVEEFVREQLAPMYRRALDGTQRTWCPDVASGWYRHGHLSPTRR